MAVAVAFASIVSADPSTGLDSTRTRISAEGTLTLTGNYGGASSHGDTMSLVSPSIPSDFLPVWVEIHENQGSASAGTANAPLGYTYIYAQGTTAANGLLQITVGTTEVTENTAYSGLTPSLNNVVLRFKAWFAKG